jgi:hypothetical protein
MTDCVIYGNSVVSRHTGLAYGGGVAAGGDATLTNCTVNLNRINVFGFYREFGGGISHHSGTLTLNNTLLTENTITHAEGEHVGGGIANGGDRVSPGGTVVLQNGSSVTGNTPDNCAGNTFTGPGCG